MPETIETVSKELLKEASSVGGSISRTEIASISRTVTVMMSVLRVEKTPPFLSNDSNIRVYVPAERLIASMTTSVAVRLLAS